MASKNFRFPISDRRLNGFACVTRFGMRRSATGRLRRGELDAAFADRSSAALALRFADRGLQL